MADILDKVRKLLALAKSDNVHEAAAAASRAQAIIDNHKVDIALLQEESDDGEEEPIRKCSDFPVFTVRQRLPLWKWDLLWALGDANGCQPWSSYEPDGDGGYHRVVYVVGRPSDARTVQYLHQYLSAEIDRLAKQHRGKGRIWLNNFRLGAVAEIESRLEEKKKYQRRALKRGARKKVKDGEDTTALTRLENALSRIEEQSAAVEKWMQANDLKHSADTSDTYESPAAFEEGRTAGASVSLGGDKTRALPSGTS